MMIDTHFKHSTNYNLETEDTLLKHGTFYKERITYHIEKLKKLPSFVNLNLTMFDEYAFNLVYKKPCDTKLEC